MIEDQDYEIRAPAKTFTLPAFDTLDPPGCTVEIKPNSVASGSYNYDSGTKTFTFLNKDDISPVEGFNEKTYKVDL